MAIDLNSLSTSMTTAQALSNLILVNPQEDKGIQPQNPISKNARQPKKFLFHYEGENTIELSSDITDHYVENNSAINDQIALKPEIVTSQGFIGELNDVVPEELKPLKVAAQKLTVISAYTPALSVSALLAYNTALQAYNLAKNISESAVSTWSTINGSGGVTEITGSESAAEFVNNIKPAQNKQQVAFQEFYGYWKNRTLFTVQTPWAVFKNMAIQSMRVVQDPDTKVISTFDITFKIMRFAETIVDVSTRDSDLDGRAFNQSRPNVNLGSETPSPSISLSSVIG